MRHDWAKGLTSSAVIIDWDLAHAARTARTMQGGGAIAIGSRASRNALWQGRMVELR